MAQARNIFTDSNDEWLLEPSGLSARVVVKVVFDSLTGKQSKRT